MFTLTVLPLVILALIIFVGPILWSFANPHKGEPEYRKPIAKNWDEYHK